MSEVRSPPLDLELRLIRYFVAVAEHGQFSSAAAALYIGQPSLSRQIRGLEHQLGVCLFERTPRGTRLSAAGEALLPRARTLLRSADEAAAIARASGTPGGVTIGYSSGLMVTPATSELRRRRPEAEVRTVHLGWRRPADALLDRQVDAVVSRLPFPHDELRVTHLYDESRAVVVRRDHRLAARPFVTVEDIADEPLPHVPGTDPECTAFWRLEPRPDGRPAPAGPAMNALEDTWEFVAAGDAVAVTFLNPGHAVRPDLAAIPLHGVEPSRVVLATRADDTAPLVTEFRRCAEAHLTSWS